MYYSSYPYQTYIFILNFWILFQSRINNSTTLSRNRIQPDSSAGFNPTYDDSTLHPPVSPSGVKRPGDAQTDPTPLIQLQHTDATSSGDTTETARGRSASGSHQHGEGIRVSLKFLLYLTCIEYSYTRIRSDQFNRIHYILKYL